MKIVMVSSEARPFCKTGGLADVVYSLSKELAVLGEDVSIIIPLYDGVRRQFADEELKKAASFQTHMSWRQQTVDVYQTKRDGINYYFIENQQYFERGHLYGDFDDGERFGFFTMAVKEFLVSRRVRPDINLASLPWRSKNSSFLGAYAQTSFMSMTGKQACSHA